MTDLIHEMEMLLGQAWMTHQRDALTDAQKQVQEGCWLRLCLYHRTGAGKTRTSLAAMRLAGVHDVLVVAPPVTAPVWEETGRHLKLDVTVVSHAKFRMKDFRVQRTQALIVDEFHLLGGHTGQGWKKMDGIARGLKAPLVIASATPNYNDAERVYCIQHVLDPGSVKGGFLQFLYQHCSTQQNPFGKIPYVDGFLKFNDAEDYLRNMPNVHYVEDEVIKQVTITDIVMRDDTPPELYSHQLDRRRERLCASQMEQRHAIVRHQLVGDDGLIRDHVYEELAVQVGQVATPTLVFLMHSEIAEALHVTCVANGAKALLVTGKDTYRSKLEKIEMFKTGEWDVLIGTATLATGTDGLDRMCNQLIILDDTPDDALRRQLVGRILPRGQDSDVSQKVLLRFVFP